MIGINFMTEPEEKTFSLTRRQKEEEENKKNGAIKCGKS